MGLSRYILPVFLITCMTSGFSQEEQSASLDSLKEIYFTDPQRQDDPVLLLQIARQESLPDSILKYSELSFKSEKAANEDSLLQLAYQTHGVEWASKGDYNKALEYLFKSAEIADKLENDMMLGDANIEIANVYSDSEDFSNAITYYKRGLEFHEKVGDTIKIAKAWYNLGDNFFEKGDIDSALEYTKKAQTVFENKKQKYLEAYSLGNLGRIYASKEEFSQAEEHLDEAIGILREFEDYAALTDFLATLSRIHAAKKDFPEAIRYAELSLKAAENHDLKNDMENAHLQLSNLYEQTGNTAEALAHYKQHVVYRDSVRNLATIQEMANLRTDFELARKQAVVDLLNEKTANQRNIAIATGIALFLIMLLALGLYRRNRYIGRTKKIIEREKMRSDDLLLNILPQETAVELKEKGKVSAKRFDAVTILFTDFRNFTHYAENLRPEELVQAVDFYFSKFDEIVERHGLEKIKTVGDAYMCAAGVPFPVEDHAEKILLAAFDMVAFVVDAHQHNPENETRFDIRVGVNSGPVVAGVVGSKKWAYDIWGDAVNIAARMETCSELGKINISENTFELVKDKFHCHYRGEIMVKNKGMMKMYFVQGQKNKNDPNVAYDEVRKM